MPKLTLHVGNRNYSSWSLRPWLAMRAVGVDFDDVVIPLDQPDTRERIAAISPAGKLPVLRDGAIVVWDTLAIMEYLAECFPHTRLWPTHPQARAHARAISAEMHAGFQALRKACPMNLWRPPEALALTDSVAADIARIDALVNDARSRFGADGPFLFGHFTIADAMYAPVATRFVTYELPRSTVLQSWIDAVYALPAFREWRDAALMETWLIPHDEVEWPTVKRVPA